jgi:hypothetical protein
MAHHLFIMSLVLVTSSCTTINVCAKYYYGYICATLFCDVDVLLTNTSCTSARVNNKEYAEILSTLHDSSVPDDRACVGLGILLSY